METSTWQSIAAKMAKIYIYEMILWHTCILLKQIEVEKKNIELITNGILEYSSKNKRVASLKFQQTFGQGKVKSELYSLS